MKQSNSKLQDDQLTTSGELFASASNIGDKGLQQYFTPPPLAALMARVLAYGTPGPFSVFDPTAGSGNLLTAFHDFPTAWPFGCDIDKRHQDKALGLYHVNLLRVMPLLEELDIRFNKISLNPPFGLRWEYNGKEHNSAELTFRLAAARLENTYGGGEGALICDMTNLPDIQAAADELHLDLWAVYTISGVFAPASACTVALVFFGTCCHYRGIIRGKGEKSFSQFDHWAPEIEADLLKVKRSRGQSSGTDADDLRTLSNAFAACCREARSAADADAQSFTLELRGNQLRVRLSDFDALKITKAFGEGWLHRVRSWSGLTLKYFALNTLELDQIKSAHAQGLVSIQPGLLDRLEAEAANSGRFTAPFYRLKPTQRLGYLQKLDRITCTSSDPDRGFIAGENYEIKTWTQTIFGESSKIVTRKDGEMLREQVREIETQQKNLRVRIGSYTFTEESSDIEYICAHFDIPEPGDITDHCPALYKKFLAELHKLESPRFQYRAFQLDDLARLCCRGGGC